ncbi:MAG: hypothetical protein KGZ58_14090 [Ignavibacteriales bacterium]|nr:hypothetical protein [Ignavibacteriales bacterium]
MPSFDTSRNIFRKFKNNLSLPAKNETLEAITKLLTIYDTAIYENRFIVGGVLEYILIAAINSIDDLIATHVGKVNQRSDFSVTDWSDNSISSFSSKASFTKSGDIRLINVLGADNTAEWDEPTIFVLSEVGIIYADPQLLNKAERVKDAVKIKRKYVEDFASANADYYFNGVFKSIPDKKSVTILGNTRTASQDVASELLKNCKTIILNKSK